MSQARETRTASPIANPFLSWRGIQQYTSQRNLIQLGRDSGFSESHWAGLTTCPLTEAGGTQSIEAKL